MNKKANEAINRIRAILRIDVKLMENKLDNGTAVVAESWEVGFPVFVMSEDGTQIPLPEGEYVLEDGTAFSVDAEGIIVSYGMAEAPPEEMEVEQEVQAPTKKVVESTTKETHFSEQETETVEVFFNDQAKNEIKEIFAELMATYEASKQELKKEVKAELSEVELAEVKPIKHSPEKKTEQKGVLFSQNRKTSTKDRVFNKLFK